MNGVKIGTCSTANDGNGRLTLGENEVRRIWKDYFQDVYNMKTQELAVVHMSTKRLQARMRSLEK